MSDSSEEAKDQSPALAAEVTIEGPGISVTRAVDEETMSKIIAHLFGGATAPTVATQGGSIGGESGRKSGSRTPQPSEWDEELTLGEFIVETEARTFHQKICAAGYYLMKFQNAQSFSRDEIRSALGDAHEDMPSNFARDFGSAASSHLIAARQGETGQFIVSRTGRTAVESRFQEMPKRRTVRRATKKSSANSDGDAE